jgi:hypothetical protein
LVPVGLTLGVRVGVTTTTDVNVLGEPAESVVVPTNVDVDGSAVSVSVVRVVLRVVETLVMVSCEVDSEVVEDSYEVVEEDSS